MYGKDETDFLVRKGKNAQAFLAGGLLGDSAILFGMGLAPEGWVWRHPAMASSI